MWSIVRPSDAAVQSFLAAQASTPFSYPEVGGTREAFPAGYQHDFNRVQLGTGEDIFQRACQAIRQWQMFPRSWTCPMPENVPIDEGRSVAVLAKALGVWWLNSCRIVYVLDESAPLRRFGFAYGTVTHAECGEERFSVEWLPDDTVWYDLRAFSRPQHWTARLGYPLARRLQRRFAQDSLQSMRAAVMTQPLAA